MPDPGRPRRPVDRVEAGSRCRFPIVDEYLSVLCGQVYQHEAAPRQVAGPGIGHRQGKAGGDRRVDGVAALLQYAFAHFCGQAFGRHYHALSRHHWQEALPVVDDGRELGISLPSCGRSGHQQAAHDQGLDQVAEGMHVTVSSIMQ